MQTETQRILASMFTENTGRHMLDSGGAYGRHWEQNQGVDFDATPYATLDIDVRRVNGEPILVDFNVTRSSYHYLLEQQIDFDPEMDALFQNFRYMQPCETSNLADMQEFIESRNGADMYVENTYNGECNLSQTLQYAYWEDDETDNYYILLQVHGGCDVRGGYTRPRVFRCDQGGLYACADAHLRAAGSRGTAHWFADDGFNYHLTDLEPNPEQPALFELTPPYGTKLQEFEVTDDATRRGQGAIYVDEDDTAHCPLTGGKLEV